MKRTLLLVGLLAGTHHLRADDGPAHCHRPDGHAPIGVMADHTHRRGEWMLSYRFMTMDMEGLRQGTDRLSRMQLAGHGFSMAPVAMSMDMHMIGAMFAPNDTVTLTAMANYLEKDMQLEALGHGAMHGHGGHMAHGGSHQHASSGWGDVVLGGLFSIHRGNTSRSHVGLALGLPTAKVEHRQGGTYLPYGMQSGTGIYDLRPSATVTGDLSSGSWGAQLNGRLALEDENDAGFRFGNRVEATAWFARPVHRTTSLSLRLLASHEEAIEGHYHGPHQHAAPPHFQGNYGGDVLSVGLGVNVMLPQGPLAGHRLAAEVLIPAYQDLNGIQLEREPMLVIGWQKAF